MYMISLGVVTLRGQSINGRLRRNAKRTKLKQRERQMKYANCLCYCGSLNTVYIRKLKRNANAKVRSIEIR
jgi:hypothetical protein